MPFYKFTIKLRNSITEGIRLLDYSDIDLVHRVYEKKTKIYYKKELVSFSVVMLSKLSKEVKEFISNQAGKEDPVTKELSSLEVFNESTPLTGSRKKGYNKDDKKPLGGKEVQSNVP